MFMLSEALKPQRGAWEWPSTTEKGGLRISAINYGYGNALVKVPLMLTLS